MEGGGLLVVLTAAEGFLGLCVGGEQEVKRRRGVGKRRSIYLLLFLTCGHLYI